MTAITCSHGGYPYSLSHGDHHNNNNNNNSNNSRPLHIVQTTTATALNSGTGNPPSYLTGSQLPPSLALLSSNLNDLSHTNATWELTEITVDTCASSNSTAASHDLADKMGLSMEVPPTKQANGTPESSPVSDKPRISKRKRTSSPPSPSSTSLGDNRRSTSRSTRRSAHLTRHSSLHSHRHAPTVTAPLTPSVPSKDLGAKREDLLALHRESCRLFQDSERTIPTPHKRASHPPMTHYRNPHTGRASSETGSAPVSPDLWTNFSVLSEDPTSQNIHQSPVLHTPPVTSTISDETYLSPIQPSATVIDWTSPSTRRREYKKIDRASSGVRGFWRRVAPKWCQFGHDRTPFFEEKDGKGNYEGSVRRFRMDLPDEPDLEPKISAIRSLKLKQKLVTTKMGSRRKSE
ncbi:hypothetical protein BDV28DRAFT_133921 [Aspergillus coremiiformis]|uniref:Uncharacterized protein n=1 Tax=Aspergillus coremiiformis TaxID=138285 RepID=A0A5N6Z5T9_9EURO|nr:hypothetical protein BDV28DRAFT_133921 [Aspergillus coremiiformis]